MIRALRISPQIGRALSISPPSLPQPRFLHQPTLNKMSSLCRSGATVPARLFCLTFHLQPLPVLGMGSGEPLATNGKTPYGERHTAFLGHLAGISPGHKESGYRSVPLPSLLPLVPPPAHSIPPFWSELAVVGDLQVSPPFLPWVGTLPSHTHPACPLFPQPGNPALAPGPHPLECPPSSVLSSAPPHTLAASLSLPQVGPPIESRNPSAASASQALSLGPCGFLT